MGLLVLVALAPNVRFLIRDAPAAWVQMPIGPSLLVARSGTLAARSVAGVRPGAQLVGLRTSEHARMRSLSTRNELAAMLHTDPPPAAVWLDIRQRGEISTLEVPVTVSTPLQRLLAEWPLILIGGAYVLLALGSILWSRHPAAAPIFVVTSLMGIGLLGRLDLVLPDDPGLLGGGCLRGRIESLSQVLVPAALLHLAMRFPVVQPRFRTRMLAAVPYAIFAIPAFSVQVAFYDGTLARAVGSLSNALSVLVLGVLLVASWASWQSLSPIERSRARALTLGGSITVIGPALFSSLRVGNGTAAESIALASLVALPAALAWAEVTYRLLEPPLWLRRGLLTALQAGSAAALAAGVVALLPSALFASSVTGGQLFLVALGTALVYALAEAASERFFSGRVLERCDAFVADGSISLAKACSPRAVAEGVRDQIDHWLRPAAIEVLDAARSNSELGRHGLILWREHGEPGRSIVLPRARTEDPSPQRPELVIPLETLRGEFWLIVVSGRANGLPYSLEERRAVRSLAAIASVAIGHAATRQELDELVARKTNSLQRALDQRAALLAAATSILAAEQPEDVKQAVRRFLIDLVGGAISERPLDTRVGHRQPCEGLGIRLELADGEAVCLEPHPLGRVVAADLRPPLSTVGAFANLALARLQLVSGLEGTVEQQTNQIGEMVGARRHAEFVRKAAHELRKPTVEMQELGQLLRLELDTPLAAKAERLVAITRDMNRRLDVLLYHSKLPFDFEHCDLVEIVEEATQRVRSSYPDRVCETRHELDRLPLIADWSLILSMVENLLDNAAKASSRGAVVRASTSLQLGKHSDDSDWVCLDVEDEGCGVPADEFESIFEPGVSHFRQGFGLGLPFCREVVFGHKGQIEVSSSTRGTCFRVLLPQLADHEHAEDQEQIPDRVHDHAYTSAQ